MTIYIKPANHDSEPPPTKTDLQAWENRKGAILAPDYVTFLQRYNGGFIYPLAFFVTYPNDHPYFDEYDETTRLNYLYPWSQFEKDNDFIQPWNQLE